MTSRCNVLQAFDHTNCFSYARKRHTFKPRVTEDELASHQDRSTYQRLAPKPLFFFDRRWGLRPGSTRLIREPRCRDDVITCKTLRWWRDTLETETNLTCEIGLRKEPACERAVRPVAPRLMKYASMCALIPIILLLVFWFPRDDGVKFLA